ncbi:MAG: histone deacetylase [Pseudomonadota bacterium]
MALPLIHHPAYDAATVADGHRFPMRKYSHVARMLRQDGHALIEPRPVTQEQLETVHDPAYVEAVLTCTVDSKLSRKIGFEITPAIVERSCASVGGTLHAARFAITAGAAVNLAGGSHHAHPEGGSGFCVFNDVGVAAHMLLARGEVAKVLVVDLDVHHGDGTARMFATRDEVFTLSVHCEDNWPLEKPPSDMDIGLPRGVGDAVYLTTLRKALGIALERAQPDFVFYNAGVDPHKDDKLGHLQLSDGGLVQRDKIVVQTCIGREIPVCGVLGGGYSVDPLAVAKRHLFLVEAMTSCLSPA